MGRSDAYRGIAPRPASGRCVAEGGGCRGGVPSPPPHTHPAMDRHVGRQPLTVSSPGSTEGPLIRLQGSLCHVATSGPKAGASGAGARAPPGSSRSSGQWSMNA